MKQLHEFLTGLKSEYVALDYVKVNLSWLNKSIDSNYILVKLQSIKKAINSFISFNKKIGAVPTYGETTKKQVVDKGVPQT